MAVLGMLRGLGAISPEWAARVKQLGGDQQEAGTQTLPGGEEDDVLKGLAAQAIQPYRPGWAALPGVASSIVGGMAAAKLRSNAQQRQAADNAAWGNYSKAMIGPGMAGPLPQTMPQAQSAPSPVMGMAGGPTAPQPAAPQPQKPVGGMAAGPVRELPDYGFGPMTVQSSQGIADQGWKPGPGMAGGPAQAPPRPQQTSAPVVQGMAGGPVARPQAQSAPQPANTQDQRVARYEREMQALQPMLQNPGTREFAIRRIQVLNDALTATMDPDAELDRRYKEAQIEKLQREAVGGNSPSNVREWEYFNRLSPEEQQRYLTMKRAEKYLDLGDRFARPNSLNPTGEPVGEVKKNLKEAAIEEGEGKNTAKRRAELPESQQRLEMVTDRLKSLRMDAEDLKLQPGLDSVVGGLYQKYTPNVSGKALNAQTALDNLKIKISGVVLQAMRDASKTGGAVGQVTEREWPRLENMLANLEQSQTKEQFLKNLDEVIRYTDHVNKSMQQAYEAEREMAYGASGAASPAGQSGSDGWSIKRIGD